MFVVGLFPALVISGPSDIAGLLRHYENSLGGRVDAVLGPS